MKKFLSMVMAAAMVVSLVPATAFAASEDVKATAKVVDVANFADGEINPGQSINSVGGSAAPELQLTLTTADTVQSGLDVEFTLTLDNAQFPNTRPTIYVKDGTDVSTRNYGAFDSNLTMTVANDMTGDLTGFQVAATREDDDEIKVRLTAAQVSRGTVVAIRLGGLTMDKVSSGKTATISVDSDDMTVANADDLVFAAVESKGIKASVKKTVDVAAEEYAVTKDIKIEPTVGKDLSVAITGGDLKLKLNSGFEFVTTDKNGNNAVDAGDTTIGGILLKDGQHGIEVDDDEIIVPVSALALTGVDTLTIANLGVEATSAKAGATATIKVYAQGCDTVSVEVAKVVEYTVSMTVDEDEDVPVIYSGVNVDNDGIVDDSDHEALEVTIKESFAGAWNNSKDFTLSVPEGVYIADVIKTGTDGDFALKGGSTASADVDNWFRDAYKEGNYVDLTFERRTWEETNPDDSAKDDPAEVSFILTLVADPNFEGDVTLTLTGDAVEEQEVTIAKFVKPYVVEAQQNDMQIDYRNTEIPTSVVIKEAEAGLWDKKTTFKLTLDKITFDDEGTIKVDEKSGLELKDNEVKVDNAGNIYFEVESRSDDEPAVVTISGMQLYMERNLPAGAYDLKLVSPQMNTPYLNTVVLNGTRDQLAKDSDGVKNDNRLIADINDDFVSYTAKAGFVNIITAGREDTDSFTTKVVVPVGESYLISGENKVEIPAPAYINAAGYTMLPLRAVAEALGINANNVLWDQTTRTATVMYGSKIINMTLGQKVVYVNGAMIPATAAVEITNDRMFLGLRDLGNALGVTDITWDAATKTATLNGSK